MKADLHPDYHEVTVVQTDGTEFKTMSTYGKAGDVIKLDVDPLSHPAWQGGTGQITEKGQLDKFESKYGSFLSGGVGQKKEKQPEAKKEEAKKDNKNA